MTNSAMEMTPTKEQVDYAAKILFPRAYRRAITYQRYYVFLLSVIFGAGVVTGFIACLLMVSNSITSICAQLASHGG